MIGQIISHFRILDALGKGGMGVVYRAVDVNLDREVAIKFLPSDISADPDAKARFIQEAKSASSLDHPNICTIYEIGEVDDGRLFIAMALYKGQTLKEVLKKGRLPVAECIAIGRQIASGLECAHGAGIVHRDIKPANVALTENSEVKILDFGLAKISDGVDVTKSHTTVGTAAYMSPEQVRNEPTDYRSDLWALGVTLYELVTGSRPFQGEYDAAVAYSILNLQQESVLALRPDVPVEFGAAIDLALQKQPAGRTASAAEMARIFQQIEFSEGTGTAAIETAAPGVVTPRPVPLPPVSPPPAHPTTESATKVSSSRDSRLKYVPGIAALLVVAALAWIFWPGASEITPPTGTAAAQAEVAAVKSIAVLPFTDLSENQDYEFFGDGIAEELRNALMGLGGIRVAARASSSFFKGKGASPQTIGDSLSVGLVLEGTFRQVGDRIRITAELTDTETGFGVWSERYDATENDALAIQDELTRAIISELEIEFGPDPARDAGPKAEISANEADAYRLYLEGKFQWNRRTEAGLRSAIDLLEESVRLNDKSAPAYAYLSMAHIILMDWGYTRPSEATSLGLEYARKAIELDANNPEAHAAMGLALEKDMSWDDAEISLDRAISLRNDYAMAVHWRGLLATQRLQTVDGLSFLEKAARMDPLSFIIGINYGWAMGVSGDVDAGIEELMRIRSFFGDHAGLLFHWSFLLAKKGKLAEAIALWEPFYEGGARDPFLMFQLGPLYARNGQEDKARDILSEWNRINEEYYMPAPIPAYIHAWLGETETAIEFFRRALQENAAFLAWTKVRPLPDELKSDPRFQQIVDEIGL